MLRTSTLYIFWLSLFWEIYQLHASDKNFDNYFDYDLDENHLIYEVSKILNKLDQESSLLHNEDVTVVFGSSSSRKSFLMQLITGDNNNLISYIHENQWVSTKTDFIQNVEESFSNLLKVDILSGMVYLEFPAFDKYSTTPKDLISKYYIWRIMSQAKSTKFLLTVDCSLSNSSDINFIDFLDVVNQITSFVIDIDKFNDSFALVVTGIDNTNDTYSHVLHHKIIETLKRFSDSFYYNNNTKGIQIINSLISSHELKEHSRIKILFKPTESGVVSQIHSLQQDKLSIRIMLKNSVRFVNINKNDFNYSQFFQAKTIMEIELFVDILEEMIQKRIKKERCIINKEILKYFSSYEEKVHEIRSLRDFFKISRIAIAQLQKSIMISPNSSDYYLDIYNDKKVIKELAKVAHDLKMEMLQQNFINILHDYKYLEFLEKYKSFKVRSFLQKWEMKEVEKFTEDSEKWYTFLNVYYSILADFKVQTDRENNPLNIKEIQNVCIKKMVPENLKDGLNRFEEVYRNYEHELKNEYQNFDKLTDIDVNQVKLEHLCSVYDQTLFEELQYDCFDNTLQIKGEFIRFDQIPPSNYCLGNIKRLELFAFDTIFINKDLIRIGEELEVVVIAPKWVVYGNRQIVLDGAPGKEHERLNAPNSYTPGFDGEDGQPGFPGGPAGSFLGIGNNLNSISDTSNKTIKSSLINNTLIISVNGGIGGKGQGGGNGAKGKNGIIGTLEFEDSYSEVSGYGKIPKEMKKCDFEGGPGDSYYCIFNRGSNGFPNGDGGDGGKGGLPGSAGSIHFFLSHNFSGIHLIKYSEDGVSGQGGNGGLGGNGSVDGQTTYTIYKYWMRPAAGRFKHRVQYNKINSSEISRTILPKGNDGESNKNVEGMEMSKKAALAQFPQSVNKYKMFLREILSKGQKWQELMNFHKVLSNEHSSEQKNNISEIDDTLGFVDELQGLEEQFFQLHDRLDFLPFYKSLLQRVTNYVDNLKSKENNKEYKSVLLFLYTAILSKICTFSETTSDYLVTNIRKNLATVSQNVQDILFASNQMSRNKINKNFKSDIDNKIRETNQFVKMIESEVHTINKKLQSELKTLTNITVARENSAKSRVEIDINRKEDSEKRSIVRGVFEVLKGVSLLASFCGPWGAIAGGLLETSEKYVQPLVLQPITEKKTKDFLIKNSIDLVLKAKTHIQSITDELWSNQKEGLKKSIENLKNKERELPDLKITREKLEDLTKADPLSDKSALDQFQIIISEEKENLNNALKELDNKENAYKRKKEVFDYLNYLQKVNRVLKSGYGISNTMNSNNDEINKIQSEINMDKSRVRQLDDFQNDIHQMIMPMLRSMRQEVNDLEKKLASSSQVALDVTKWQVGETLTNIKKRLQGMTKDFPQVSEIFGYLVQKLIDTLNTLINVYQRMEQYQDRKILVDYIAQINSPSVRDLNVDEKLNYAISYLKVVLATNSILDPYKRTMNTFKQYVFPFAKYYMAEFGLPTDLQINDMNSVRSIVTHQMSRLIKNIDRSDVSVIPEVDEHIHIGKFSIESEFNGPFYIWKNDEFKLKIGELLYGKKVILVADVSKGLKKNAVKFKTIELKFVTTNSNLQGRLDAILKKFQVTMTHTGNSYYRCGEKIYTITTSKQTFSYTLQKYPENQLAMQTSLSYLKLQQGDFLLSPYTLWEVQLKTNFGYLFDELKDYRHQVDIALIGLGQYVDTEIDICDSDLNHYYKMETNSISDFNSLYDYEAQEYVN